MEVWLLACMLLVFLSLVEYTIILRKIVAHNRMLERHKKEAARRKSAEFTNGVNAEFKLTKNLESLFKTGIFYGFSPTGGGRSH